MFGLSNKKNKKEKIDSIILNMMKDYADETERSYRHLIKSSIEDFPDEKIAISTYGIYKARLGTNLMIAAGANSSKIKIGYGDSQDFLDDVQIATAIAHTPFTDENSNEYLDKSEIKKSTEEIVKFLLGNLKRDPNKIFNLSFSENDQVFKKLMIYFQNCVSESVSDKIIMNKIIELNDPLFKYLTSQNLKIMSECMRL